MLLFEDLLLCADVVQEKDHDDQEDDRDDRQDDEKVVFDDVAEVCLNVFSRNNI